MLTYEQRTGIMIDRAGQPIGTGYSGKGAGRNNTFLQNIKNIGPIPKGFYKIGPVFDHQYLGPGVMQLWPVAPLLNKRSDFFIHGDNANHDASTGCIVLDKTGRAKIVIELANDSLLEVL